MPRSSEHEHMQRMKRGIVVLAGMLAWGCHTPSDERVGREGAAVRGGAAARGDAAVVAIYGEAIVLCTGTVISPRVIVTAAHCLHPDLLSGHDLSEVEVRVGSSAFFPDRHLAIAEGVYHPDFDPTNLNLLGNPDVGLVRLAEPIDVPPVAIHRGELLDELLVDAPLRIVGYGVTAFGEDDYGTKREATAQIKSIPEDSISLRPAAMCAGDSGGPYLFESGGQEHIVAVHSNGNCTTTSEGTRLDAVYESFVRPFVEHDCVADGYCLELCETVADPDCASGLGAGGAGGGDETGGATAEDDDQEEDGCRAATSKASGWTSLVVLGALAAWSRARGSRRAQR